MINEPDGSEVKLVVQVKNSVLVVVEIKVETGGTAPSPSPTPMPTSQNAHDGPALPAGRAAAPRAVTSHTASAIEMILRWPKRSCTAAVTNDPTPETAASAQMKRINCF